MTRFRRNENPIRDRRLIDPGGGGGSLVRAILLEDLVSGGTVEAAVMNYQSVDEIQMVSLVGEITGGTFTLTFDGETTAAIQHNATAEDLKSALEALPNIDPGDVIITRYTSRWLVQFTGQYAGVDVPLMTASESLPGVYNDVTVTSEFSWVDSGGTVDVHCQIPVGTPSPLEAGTIVTISKLRGTAFYGIVNAECRDLAYDY